LQLRPYQLEAADAATAALAAGEHPVLALATGTGKSLIMAEIAERARRAGQRVWLLTHVQQLVAQNATTYERHTGRRAAVVCAGLNRRERDGAVTFGSLQTMLRAQVGMPPPQLIIIDEAHRVPHRDGDAPGGMYAALLARHPQARRLAMTATPWRMDNGLIYGAGAGFWFDRLAYEYNVPRAVAEGYLSPLVGVEAETQLDVDDAVELQSGDFAQGAVARLQTEKWLAAVARSLPALAGARRHLAVYCPTVAAARRAAETITAATGWAAEVLTGGAALTLRQDVLGRFATGQLRVLCSVDMLTTGFDLPALDCIVALRPTLSSSLWVQMQGRGTRLAEGKKNCLVLDYVGNLQRLGGVGMYETYYRQQHATLEQVPAAEPTRPYARRERKVYPGVRTLAPLDPMTGAPAGEAAELPVTVHAVNVVPLVTRRGPHPVLLVQYACTTREGARIDAARFINTERPDSQVAEFFRQRQLAVNLPAPARTLTWQLRGARRPTTALVRRSGRYWNVVAEHFEEAPPHGDQ
jgi:DNA repair protein RadD